MKRFLTITIMTLSGAAWWIFNQPNFSGAKVVEPTKALQKTETFGKVPLMFERNHGQTDTQVKFLSRGAGYALFLTETEAVLKLRTDECGTKKDKTCERQTGILRMGFEGANRQPQISGADEIASKSNYLNLDGTGEKIMNVANFERVNYSRIYDGIDLVFYGNERQLEYDFNIAPFADPSQIKLNFAGTETLSIDTNGDLVAQVAGKNVKFTAPIAYQTINGEKVQVEAKYVITEQSQIANRKSQIHFALGEYDESTALVIDPILQYSSYLGGGSGDFGNAITVNAAGEAYIAGQTYSPDFPVANAIQPNLNGTSDGFLTKFNASGTGIIFSTYLGGAEVQSLYGIALDTNGNIALTGTDTRNGHDLFIGKLNAVGNALVYPTVFIGGTGADEADALDLDAAGNIYVTGRTDSTNFPTTGGVIQPNDGAGIGAFAVRVNANGAIGYSTYLDGAEDNFGSDIAVDGAGNAYIVGFHGTNSVGDIFILKLNPMGSALVYPTFYFGGSGSDIPADVEIDDNGNAYIGGSTFSDNFPTTAGVVQPTFGGNTMFTDGFVAKVNASGNALVWATYLGSTSSEYVSSLKLDSAGGIYVTGNLATTGDYNFFVAHLNGAATALDYNAQFGGTNADFSSALALDADDNIYLTGYTGSNDYLTTAGAFDRTYSGTADGFIMKIAAPEISGGATPLNVNVPGNSVPNNEKFVAHLNVGDQVTVNNISGTVNFNPQGQTNGCPYSTNANGLDRAVYDDPGNQLICYYSEWSPNHLDPLLGANHGHAGLYMMRGTAKTFIGLNGATFTATADQPLYLGINDGGTDPNTGSFNARVTINRAATVEPTLSANTVTVPEGNSGTTNAVFTVSLTPESNQTVTVRYQTANGTATAGQDYTATGGTLTFAPGETSKTVNVPVISDTLDEPDEFFTLQLINPTNAQTVFPRGRANIIDDDATPSIVVSDVSLAEGNSGTTNATFVVSLSNVSGNTVTVNCTTQNGTATAGQDYTAVSIPVSFAPGSTSRLFIVPIVGDTLVEANETFTVNLSAPTNATIADAQGIGTIRNDDMGGTIQFAASTASVNEAAGSITLTVNRTGGAASGVTVNYATTNGTATAPQDYTTTNGTLTFGANEMSKTIVVPIINDTNVEANETFNINLSSVTGGATLGSPSNVTVTIVDNDSCSFSITPISQNFTASGGTGTIAVTAPTGCAWTATESLNWVTITNGASGSGNSTIAFTVAANTGAARNGAITVAGQPFTINQSAATIIRSPFDFDGDGKTDISIFRPASGEWWYLKSSNGGNAAFQFGASTDRLVPTDYTGDGKTDLAFWRPVSGQWFILRSEDSSFYAFPFGASGDTPVPADYDGDGKSDASVFRESSLTWFIQKSSGGTEIIGFGATGDKPVVADYDGDGKADVAVYRPNAGEWWIRRSSNGSVFVVQFGTSTDKPVQGDFTGDGKADVAFFRPSNGNWFILRSEDFSFFSFPFGTSGDIPVPGDYDGDGRFDAGVFRPTNSNWFVQRSTAGTLIQQFGIMGDRPVPNSFVP